MITLLCFATASIILGMFFNIYALVALCAAVALIDLIAIFSAGVVAASMAMVVDLTVVQIGFLAGLSASNLLPIAKRVSLPSSNT
jgi:hypothetical protein